METGASAAPGNPTTTRARAHTRKHTNLTRQQCTLNEVRRSSAANPRGSRPAAASAGGRRTAPGSHSRRSRRSPISLLISSRPCSPKSCLVLYVLGVRGMQRGGRAQGGFTTQGGRLHPWVLAPPPRPAPPYPAPPAHQQQAQLVPVASRRTAARLHVHHHHLGAIVAVARTQLLQLQQRGKGYRQNRGLPALHAPNRRPTAAIDTAGRRPPLTCIRPPAPASCLDTRPRCREPP